MEDFIEELKNLGYQIDYCDHCDRVCLICPKCKINSCSGGGCDFCSGETWEKFKTSILHDLTKEEFLEVFRD